MSATLEKSGRWYYLHTSRGGTHQRINTGATTIRDARRAADRINALFDREKQSKLLTRKICEYAVALARGELMREALRAPLRSAEAAAALSALSVIEELFPAPPVTAAELWSRYLATRPEVKPVTLKTRRQRFAIFEAWARDRDMTDFTVADCRRFLNGRGDASGQTIKNYISDISVVFDAAGVNNPWKTPGLRPKHVEHAETPPMDYASAKRLLAYCDDHATDAVGGIALERWAAFFRAMYYSGQRPIDVCHFEYAEFDGEVIDLIPTKTSRTERHVNYKADPRLRQLLAALPREDKKYFFPEFAAEYDRGRSRPGRYYRKIATAAGVDPGLKLYSFRHGFITYQLNAGADDDDLSAAVGHESTATTKKHYYHGKKTVVLPELPEL